MKALLNYLSIAFLLVIAVVGCKKKYDKDFIGPDKQIDFKLVEPFVVSTNTVDFSNPNANKVYFKAAIDIPTNIRVTITGTESYAQRNLTLYGTKFDSTLFWGGEQDSLYYFREGEKCIVTFSTVDETDPNLVTVTLEDRGVVVDHGTLFAQDTITIVKTKPEPKGQVRLFPKHPVTGLEGRALYIAGYDNEALTVRLRKDMWDTISIVGSASYVFTNKSLIPYAKGPTSITGERYFMLQGEDIESKYPPIDKPDYYIGRLALAGGINLTNPGTSANSPNKLLYGGNGLKLSDSVRSYSAEEVYFSVFVYGNGDGSQINYTVKELEGGNSYADDKDESYEKSILINFKGWKLFTFRYSEFTYAETKDTESGKGSLYNGKKEPSKIVSVQFGLVASKLGGFGQCIIDNPVVSWGRPFKY